MLLNVSYRKGIHVNNALDLLDSVTKNVENYAQSVDASTLTPEELELLRQSLHKVVDTRLCYSVIYRPCSNEDPVFELVDPDGVKKKIFIRWDGVWTQLDGGRIVRIADPFDLNGSLRRTNRVQQWKTTDAEISVEPLQEFVPYGYGFGDIDRLVMRITKKTLDSESSRESFEIHYFQFSRAELLARLDEIIPMIGRLVLIWVERDEFGLEIQYHHRRRRGDTQGGAISVDETVFDAVAKMHGETLALELLDETR